MKYHNISDYALYKDDFMAFQHEQYDIVVSFGFLEHFPNWKDMLAKHIELVKPGGYLVVSVPNLRNFQYHLHKWLDPEFENEQVVESTNLETLRGAVNEDGLTVVHAGYYQTFQFFCHHRQVPRNFLRRYSIDTLRLIGAFFTRTGINIPNRNFSPQVVCIAKKE